MSLTDDLQRLAELRSSGVLTEAEFKQAKAKLLEDDAPARPAPRAHHPDEDTHDQSLGRAANRYVSFQMVMTVVGILIFLLVLAPRMCGGHPGMFR